MEIKEKIFNQIASLKQRINDLVTENDKLKEAIKSEKDAIKRLEGELSGIKDKEEITDDGKELIPLNLNPVLFEEGGNVGVKKRLKVYISELSSYIKILERKNKKK